VLLVEDDDADALLVEDYLAAALPQAGCIRARSAHEATDQLHGSVDCVGRAHRPR
jgi:hypothetical protein